MTELVLDRHQRYAFTRFTAWLENPNKPQVFPLFGYAGTGKTTLATYIARKVDADRILFATFTGKAALVLSNKLQKAGLAARATTIHRLIYIPISDDETGEVCFILNEDSDLRYADLLIIDEVSMVSRKIALDLESFGVPILVIGDPAQLPPVKGMEHYIGRKPAALLTQIHRQAQGNPILTIADQIRRGLPMPARGEQGNTVKVMAPHDLTPAILLDADIRLVGKNSTRHLLNDQIRSLLGFSGDIPRPAETVVCLRNCYDFQIDLYNGELWKVLASEKRTTRFKDWSYTIVEMEICNTDDQIVNVQVPVGFFYGLEGEVPVPVREHHQQFAFGYALTTHKAQGSEWDRVLLFDQPVGHFARWRYTAVTRAAQSLIIIR
jgi:exodeoxyribonuclease V